MWKLFSTWGINKFVHSKLKSATKSTAVLIVCTCIHINRYGAITTTSDHSYRLLYHLDWPLVYCENIKYSIGAGRFPSVRSNGRSGIFPPRQQYTADGGIIALLWTFAKAICYLPHLFCWIQYQSVIKLVSNVKFKWASIQQKETARWTIYWCRWTGREW